MLYHLSQKGLAAAKGMVGEVDRAGGKGTKCLLGTYQIPRAVYHFTSILHITLGTAILILNSLAVCLKIQYIMVQMSVKRK